MFKGIGSRLVGMGLATIAPSGGRTVGAIVSITLKNGGAELVT